MDDKKSYIQRLEALCKNKDLVEVVALEREITGQISEVGEDFIGITCSVEKEITNYIPKEGGGTEPEKHIVVTSLETFLKFTQIDSISHVKKQVVK
jgi:hypothetical protein